MAITGMVHVNVNCSDYQRSLAFYRVLGFEEVWRVPETHTPEVAAAVGMPPYRVRGGLLALRGATPPMAIDLLQWLEAAGAEFLSKPAQMPPSSGSNARFVCFKDPDGTVLELVQR